LNYLDDRPVFDKERMTCNAWAVGGLEGERKERDRIRDEETAKQNANFEAMRLLQERGREKRLAMYGEEKPLVLEGGMKRFHDEMLGKINDSDILKEIPPLERIEEENEYDTGVHANIVELEEDDLLKETYHEQDLLQEECLVTIVDDEKEIHDQNDDDSLETSLEQGEYAKVGCLITVIEDEEAIHDQPVHDCPEEQAITSLELGEHETNETIPFHVPDTIVSTPMIQELVTDEQPNEMMFAFGLTDTTLEQDNAKNVPLDLIEEVKYMQPLEQRKADLHFLNEWVAAPQPLEELEEPLLDDHLLFDNLDDEADEDLLGPVLKNQETVIELQEIVIQGGEKIPITPVAKQGWTVQTETPVVVVSHPSKEPIVQDMDSSVLFVKQDTLVQVIEDVD
jgi:hypothetical protein